MFNFNKYNSITNIESNQMMKHVKRLGYDDPNIQWVVLLKIHGANFSFWTDGETVEIARRNDFTTLEEKSHKVLYNKYKIGVINTFHYYKQMHEDLKTMVLFGEMFGGMYTHPEVPRIPTVSRIQKGVHYCPHVDFALFDVVVDGRIVSHCDTMGIGKVVGCVTLKPLFAGTFGECIKHSNEFQDPLHKEFDLPEIEDNVCEGIVIKPVDPLFFNNGKRVIIKSKNDTYKEKAGEKVRIRTPEEPLSEETQGVVDEMSKYITENRLTNVLSHHEKFGKKDFGKIMGLFMKDIHTDFMEDHSDKYIMLEKFEVKRFKRHMNQWCSEVVRPVFLEMIQEDSF